MPSEPLPQVCNKLMYGAGQLKVMFVGGGNQRKDYHVEDGEEIFYMWKGNMNLPIMVHGKPRTVYIREGEWFRLPRRIPHSPQRPEQDSMGFVMERSAPSPHDIQSMLLGSVALATVLSPTLSERDPGETDALRYYTDDWNVLWEETFYCSDLGSQLPPVIKKYFASEQYRTGKLIQEHPNNPVAPYEIDLITEVADPIPFGPWLATHRPHLNEKGTYLIGSAFGRGESKVIVFGGGVSEHKASPFETFLWQFEGDATVSVKHEPTHPTLSLPAGSMLNLPKNVEFTVKREPGAMGVLIQMWPKK